jgi:hypothetical protein
VQGYLAGRPVSAGAMQQLLADPTGDHGLGESLEVVDDAAAQDPSMEIANLVAEAASSDVAFEPLVRTLLGQLERAAGLGSTYLAVAREGQKVLIGAPPDGDGGQAGGGGPPHHLRVPVVAADGREVGELGGVSRDQPGPEAEQLIMLSLLARTIADRLDPAPPARAPATSTTPPGSRRWTRT